MFVLSVALAVVSVRHVIESKEHKFRNRTTTEREANQTVLMGTSHVA